LLSLDKIANLLVLLLLFEMMIAIGLGVSLKDLSGVLTDTRLIIRAVLANYVLVPAIAILLLHLFQSKPMVAVGFLLVAVCPAAPFAPPLTAMSKGNVTVSVGLMVVLAASSALLAPLLLALLMPLVARGPGQTIDTAKIVATLFISQLLPLAIGLGVRAWRPNPAQRLLKPFNALTGILSVVVFALIISLQYQTLADIRVKGFVGMCVLILLCLATGWILGTKSIGVRKSLALTTAARNVGVALVIATASFPASDAVTSVIIFAIAQTLIVAFVALLLGRFSPDSHPA
jgi:bile acid:Na+ symporter, BASS family